jgi:hypothetical protein
MIDLDAKVRSLVERGFSRKEIIRQLDDIAAAAERQAIFARHRDQRHRADDEKAIVARIGRLLFFLRNEMPAFGATDADRELYDVLRNIKD